MSKHTPGPWYKNGYYYQRDEASPTGRRAMLCGGDSTLAEGWTINAANTEVCHIRSHNRVSDARLIAASPDLLAALEFARDCLTELAELVENGTFDAAVHWVESNGEVWDAIRAAIAKARGE